MRHLYLFTLEVTPLEVGKVYEELPSHLTLMSRFWSGLPADELSGITRPLFVQTKPIELIFGETIELGPKKLTVHTVTNEAVAGNPKLMNPDAWQKRTQIKDRVYNVEVDGKSYIMKERKTARHTDVMAQGHRPGLTSAEEFAAAHTFAKLGTVRQGDIQLRWEKPLGYVEFPNGYQFAMFESEPGLDAHYPLEQLVQEIVSNRDQFQDEYTQIAKQAKAIYEERTDLVKHLDSHNNPLPKPKRFAFTKASRQYKKEYQSLPAADELTFEQYAERKARIMIGEGKDLLADTILSQGYVNSDNDGYDIIVTKGNGVDKRPGLSIIGYDFEYYTADPSHVRHRQNTKLRNAETGRDIEQLVGFRIQTDRDIERAADYALATLNGRELPAPR